MSEIVLINTGFPQLDTRSRHHIRPRGRNSAADRSRPRTPLRTGGDGEFAPARAVRSAVAHPVTRPDQGAGARTLIATGLLSAVVVAGMVGVAHWRAGGVAGSPATPPPPAQVVSGVVTAR